MAIATTIGSPSPDVITVVTHILVAIAVGPSLSASFSPFPDRWPLPFAYLTVTICIPSATAIPINITTTIRTAIAMLVLIAADTVLRYPMQKPITTGIAVTMVVPFPYPTAAGIHILNANSVVVPTTYHCLYLCSNPIVTGTGVPTP
ncbi:hypothetical protein FN846DRAFT_907866 [Sphaerosporella brunnea]|uniref:Uncharacterized protein n=1 Tax=Sphaerosporella brunnea TaxID=1250544 RepID=A0A5J5EVB4_9PEZI|nr:hypothetical protein FN846DRAFT_907866 [Sphaerosporella brunnea]